MLPSSSLRSTGLALCAFTLLLPSRMLPAEDAKIPIEQILPDRTLVLVSIPDVRELKSRFAETVWSDFLNDSEIKPLRDKLVKLFEKSTKDLERELGIGLPKLLEIPQGEVSFAVSRLARGKLGLLLSIEYGDDSTTLDRLLGEMEKKFEDNRFTSDKQEIEGVTVFQHTPPNQEPRSTESVCWFQKDGFFILSNQTAMLEAVLVRWDGTNNAVLAEVESFRYTRDRCRPPAGLPIAYWYLDPIGLVRSAMEAGGSTTQQAVVMTALPQLGLDRLKAIGGSIDLASEKYEEVTRMFVYAEGPHRGILKMMQAETRPIEPPGWVSASAESYLTMHWDIQGAWSEVREMVDSFQGAGALEVMLDRLADHPDSPGLHPQKDFIDLLSGTIHFEQTPLDSDATDEEEFSLLEANILVALELTDAARMSTVLDTLQQVAGSPLKRRSFQGATLYDIEIPGELSTAVSLMVARQTLFIGSNPQRIEQIARGDEAANSLRDSASFKRLSADAPASASVWGMEQSGIELEGLIEQIELLFALLNPGEDEDLDLDEAGDELPSAETLEKYVTESFFYAIPDPRGVYMESHTPRIAR
jgi:hypothetical protein